MADNTREVSVEDYHRICQFYFREARLLDERQYQQWLGLLTEDVAYRMPSRHTPMLEPALRETEALLNVQQELGDAMQPPLREDNFFTLSIRVMRSFKMNSWTDNPPSRTTRLVSNIEVHAVEGGFETYSNLLLSYSRYGSDNTLYTARRHDLLKQTPDGLRIARRTVMLDWNVVVGPSVGMFF